MIRADTAAIDGDTSLVVSPDTLQVAREKAFVFYRDSFKIVQSICTDVNIMKCKVTIF